MQIESNYTPSLSTYGGRAGPEREHAHGGASRGRLDTVTTALRASRSQQASLEIVTAEGDRVSLQTQYVADISLDRFEAGLRRATGGARRFEQNFSANVQSSVSLEVEGDLNEEELADIQSLIKDMEQMGASLLTGTLDAGISLGGSLAAAQGQLSYREMVTTSVTRTSLRPGRAQRQAAREAADIVRRRPERAPELKEAVPRAADRVFDRLAKRFGEAPAEAARAAFHSVLGEELARATETRDAEDARRVTAPRLRRLLDRYFDGPPVAPEAQSPGIPPPLDAAAKGPEPTATAALDADDPRPGAASPPLDGLANEEATPGPRRADTTYVRPVIV